MFPKNLTRPNTMTGAGMASGQHIFKEQACCLERLLNPSFSLSLKKIRTLWPQFESYFDNVKKSFLPQMGVFQLSMRETSKEFGKECFPGLSLFKEGLEQSCTPFRGAI